MHFPIHIGVRRSFFLGQAVLLAHAAATLILYVPDWPAWLAPYATFALLASVVFYWRQCRPGVETLRLLADGRLECLCRGDADFSEAQLLPGATLHPLLTVIRLRNKGKVHSVVLLPDSATAEERRCLRVWLRWRATFALPAVGASDSG